MAKQPTAPAAPLDLNGPPPEPDPAPRKPTAAELSELGVEILPATRVRPQGRVAFVESELPGEPRTDRKLTLESGLRLRERIVLTAAPSEGVLTTEAAAAPTGATITISLVELEEGDQVRRDGEGGVRKAPVHEVLLTGENVARLGSEEALRAAIDEQREVAAARAAAHFAGMGLLTKVLGERATAPPQIGLLPAPIAADELPAPGRGLPPRE